MCYFQEWDNKDGANNWEISVQAIQLRMVRVNRAHDPGRPGHNRLEVELERDPPLIVLIGRANEDHGTDGVGLTGNDGVTGWLNRRRM